MISGITCYPKEENLEKFHGKIRKFSVKKETLYM